LKIHPRHCQARCNVSFAAGLLLLLLPVTSVRAQLTQLNNLIGDRIEAATILGGDFGVSGAFFTGDNGATIDLQKFGGAGDVGDPRPLGNLGIGWQPRLQGSMGYLSSKNDFTTGQLAGAESKFHSYSIQFGGGARLWFNDAFSIAPTVMGMYGHTKNDFYANTNQFAITNQPLARQLGLIDWTAETCTIRPAMDFQYIYLWRRAIFTLSSDPTYFHTGSFSTSNPNVSVSGDSETWENKIDVDIPLGKKLFGHELRTGGSLSRTEFFGDIKNGLNTDHLYEIHGRLTLDYLNQLWKVQWIGIGGSYLWGNNFHGYSIGADVQFRF
jgi:hypothetical protein